MLDRVAYCYAESEQKDLSDGVEGSAEYNVTDRPSIFECPKDENEL